MNNLNASHKQYYSIRNYPKYVFCLGIFLLLVLLLNSGCSVTNPDKKMSDTPSFSSVTAEATPTTLLAEIVFSKTNEHNLTPNSTESPFFEEKTGCLAPSEDYSQIRINEHLLNQRTFEMLAYAQSLYGGEIDITGDAITQGSYTENVDASFGTHAGGGAVDLSVMSPGTYDILYRDIPNLVQALRLAGFAAWFRDFDELYPGSPPHIHAIGIGDRELSIDAREQLAGPFGYFWGYNGLPMEDKVPIRDPHGGQIVCEWMIEKGYPNKTATPSPLESLP